MESDVLAVVCVVIPALLLAGRIRGKLNRGKPQRARAATPRPWVMPSQPRPAQRVTPREPSPVALAFLAPALQSLFTGALLAGCMAVLLWWTGDAFPEIPLVLIPLVLGALVTWLVLLVLNLRKPTGGDAIPRERPPIILRARSGQPTTDPAQAEPAVRFDPRAFTQFVKGCGCGTGDTSMARWVKVLGGRAHYTYYRDLLLDAGWARWRPGGRPQGWELTATADVILAAMLDTIESYVL